MAGMILSTYVFRVFPHLPLVAQGTLVVFISLGCGLDCWFHPSNLLVRSESSCDSKLDGALCGDSSSSLDLSSCRHHRNCLCDLEFWFLLTFYLYPLIYSDLKKHPLPLAMLGQEGIYCAPFSLLLASLVRVGGAGLPTWLLIVMILASQSFFSLFWLACPIF